MSLAKMEFIHVLCHESRPIYIYRDWEKCKEKRRRLVAEASQMGIILTEADFPVFRLKIEDTP